jgi:DNA-binding transcriptional regulator YiaG
MITANDLKRLRKRRGESQAEFAGHFRVGRTTILNWETKGPPASGAAKHWFELVLRQLCDKSPQEAAE